MPDIKLISYNVKGLNSPRKRHKILRELDHLGGDIVFLQETHLTLNTRVRLFSPRFPQWFYGDSPDKGSKGVAIGLSKAANFLVRDRLIDPEGRFLFLKGSIGTRKITLANVYCPNRSPTVFLGQMLEKLMGFGEGEMVLAGDMNFCLDPAQDSTSRAQGIKKVSLRAIKRKLYHCQLIDVWRIQHVRERDYTFHSPVHGTYSRLDYIFVDHSLLEGVVDTSIETTTLSDHSPVTMRLKLPELGRRPFSWKLNESLLKDPEVIDRIQSELNQFFILNDTGEVSPSIIWEAHKAYIRGVFISIGVGQKKKRREKKGKTDSGPVPTRTITQEV